MNPTLRHSSRPRTKLPQKNKYCHKHFPNACWGGCIIFDAKVAPIRLSTPRLALFWPLLPEGLGIIKYTAVLSLAKWSWSPPPSVRTCGAEVCVRQSSEPNSELSVRPLELLTQAVLFLLVKALSLPLRTPGGKNSS